MMEHTDFRQYFMEKYETWMREMDADVVKGPNLVFTKIGDLIFIKAYTGGGLVLGPNQIASYTADPMREPDPRCWESQPSNKETAALWNLYLADWEWQTSQRLPPMANLV